MSNNSGNTTTTKESPTMVRFSGRDALEDYLCGKLVELLRSGIETRGQAALAVSGGRTPTALFQRLSTQSLDWQKVTIVLVDERWVDADHEASNERLVRQNLLQHEAAKARFISLKNAAYSAVDGSAALQEQLQSLPSPMDAVILGMGEDGHTASFFPGAETLSQALDLDSGLDCQAVTPIDAPHERMTLTLPRLLNSRQIFLHLCGDSKLPVLDLAMAAGATEDMPVRAVLRQTDVPVDICWAP